jgi:hypothetical protein
MSSANRVKGFLFEKEINTWLSKIVLLYPVDENISLFSFTIYFYQKYTYFGYAYYLIKFEF